VKNSTSQNEKPLQILSTETTYTGPLFSVRRDRVIEPHGLEATREMIAHPGSVVVLPVFEDGRILLIRQYRYAAKQFLWELVAGRKDDGEDFLHGAHRELLEETGYTARSMKQLVDLFPTPGFLEEHMVIFLAQGLKEGVAQQEADERISHRIFTLDEVERWIRAGKIRDMKSIAGILYYAKFIASRSRKPSRKRASHRTTKSASKRRR
jgi:ADP-ribose pyrophosphatase